MQRITPLNPFFMIPTTFLFLLLTFCIPAFAGEVWINGNTGNDANLGTEESPLYSINAAMDALGGKGGTVYATGRWDVRWYFNERRFTAEVPLRIECDDAMVWGFALPPPYNPETHNERTMDSCLILSDCEHIYIRGLEVQGGGGEGIALSDSYPWRDEAGVAHGLGWITLDGIIVNHCKANGVFTGGYVLHDITIKNYKVLNTIVPPGHGDTNHGIYISGGNWKPEWPAYWNIKIMNGEVTRTGGRHCLQFNCRADNVRVTNNLFRHAQLCGFSSIGVQDLVYENNISYGHNRCPVVIYDYDWYVNWEAMLGATDGPRTLEDWRALARLQDEFLDMLDAGTMDMTSNWDKGSEAEYFLATHQPNQRHLYKNNTFYNGPVQWEVDQWHNNKPDHQPVIQINNDVHWKAVQHGYKFPPEDFVFQGNILVGTTGRIIDTYNEYETEELTLLDNMIWTLDGSAPYLSGAGTPKFIGGTIAGKDPRFSAPPIYPPLVDLTKTPYYDFEKDHNTIFNAYSIPGKKHNMGKRFRVSLLGNKVQKKTRLIRQVMVPSQGTKPVDLENIDNNKNMPPAMKDLLKELKKNMKE